MKKFLVTIAISLLSFVYLAAQNIGIGTNSPNGSAALDVTSISKGLLIPRMTSAQRTAIASPANGLMVYDITTNSFWYHNGNGWTNLTAGGGGGTFTLPFNATATAMTTVFKIKNDEPGYTAIEGESETGTGLSGKSAEGPGVSGTSITQNGVYGYSASGNGVYAKSGTGPGLYAHSGDGVGINVSSNSNSALTAFTNNSNPTINVSNNSGTAVKITSVSTGLDAKSTTGNAVSVNSISGVGLVASSTNNYGLEAKSEHSTAIYAQSNSDLAAIAAANFLGPGIRSASSKNNGVEGQSFGSNKAGVMGQGFGDYAMGVYGYSISGTGVRAESNSGLALDVAGKIRFTGSTNPGNGKILTSDGNGYANWQNPVTQKIGFSCRGAAGGGLNVLANDLNWHKIHFGVENYDPGNDYTTYNQTPSSTFTVPISGFYNLSAFITWYHAAIHFNVASIRLVVERAGTTFPLATNPYSTLDDGGWFLSSQIGLNVHLIAGDKIWVEGRYYWDSDNNSSIQTNTEYSSFSGYLIFAD